MALEYNRTNPNSYKIISDIEKFFNLFFKDLKIPNHTDWRFDDVICFTTSMLYRLDDRIAFSLIEVLCSITEDFSVSNRPKQEAAIYILTYLLCENKGLPNKIRTKVFLATYGKSLYKIQHDEWNYISNSSSFYSEFAEKMFMDACELIDGKYAKKQPNFIFLYGYFTKNIKLENIDTPKNADIFLKYCAYIQAQSWYQGNMRRDAIIIDKIKILFDYVHNYLKKTSEDNILKFVYGSNLLCYALSNIIRNQGKCFIEKKKILEIIILTDFYNRYYNATYNFAKYLEQPSSMFLLCGPIRVVCCIQLDDLNYELDNEKLKMYRIWYNNENGRYKMLLTRLLSYTNFFSQLNIKIEDILTKGELFTDFLAYDNMPSTEDERNKFLEKPRTLFIK